MAYMGLLNKPGSEVVAAGAYMSLGVSEGAGEDSCEDTVVDDDETRDDADSKAGSISPFHAI
jgi:hypothetical protein